MTSVILLCIVAMILTMSVKQHIFNIDPSEPTTEQVEGCQNISYIKMSDKYYQWELYSSMSKYIHLFKGSSQNCKEINKNNILKIITLPWFWQIL